MKQYTLSLTSGLRFVIICFLRRCWNGFLARAVQCMLHLDQKSNSETFSTPMHPSGTARQGGYRRHFGRSLPSGFPTQILYTCWTLFSNHFFFLAFDFRQFSFFLLPLLMRSLCRPLKMLQKLSSLSSSVSVSRVTFCTLASTQLICFTLKSWANSSPCFKISPLDWKSVESCSFKAFT